MDQEAYHGLAGDVVRTIEPHTEADPVAILVQVLTNVGNIIGRCPYYQVESDYHRTNLFCVIVGQSSKARKGTSAGRVHAVVGPRGRAMAGLPSERWPLFRGGPYQRGAR